MDFAAIESGLGTLLGTLLSLASGAVLWVNQNAPEPATSVHTWLSLKKGDLGREGPVDAVQKYPTPGTPDAGQELTLRAQGPRRLPLYIQAYSRAGSTGNGSAYALLANLTAQLNLPSTQDALGELGLGLNKVGNVVDLSRLADERITGRASLDIQLNLVATAEERVGYIARVQGDFELSPDPSPIPFDTQPTP